MYSFFDNTKISIISYSYQYNSIFQTIPKHIKDKTNNTYNKNGEISALFHPYNRKYNKKTNGYGNR